MIPPAAIVPEALRPRVEGDFANDRVKQDIAARLFGDPAPAARIGRFTVIRELGRGGTGIVYAAYDEQLERKIAVKLLHADAADDAGRARLLREAQAMARLSHPHIVSVHEVGTHHGQIYIAMEFVHGVTLGAWLAQPRSWREVVEVFRQAGSGLAAAHQASLVHRDFKPANAMVGADGRVRVLDFGLARADGDPDLMASTRDSDHELRALDTSITITGSLIGTPAFMSPEQFRGEKADPRSDQFALCVALYEGLYRARPFAGDSLSELMSSVLAGQIREPVCHVKLPRGLRAAIFRGLQRRPEHRFPTMDALLAAIDRAVEPRRGPWLIGAGLAAGLAVGITAMAYQTEARGQICEARGAGDIASVWSPERAVAIGEALRAVDPQADDSWPQAVARFDAYAAAWQAEVVADCTASELHHEQSAAQSQLRRACLDDRLRGFEAALDLFDRPESILAVRSPDIAAGLIDPATCADPHELQRRAAAPDPDARDTADLRAGLATAEAMRRATMHDDALVRLDTLATRAAPEQVALRAELELTRGRILANVGRNKEALPALQSAYFGSLTAGEDRLAIAAAIELIGLSGEGLADFTTAERWEKHAQALLARGGDASLRAHLASAQGRLHAHSGRYVEAQADFRRALELHAEAGEQDTAEAAVVQRSLADAAISAGDLDEAESQLTLARGVLAREFCDRHPDRAAALNSAGALAMSRGDLTGALASFEQGRANLAGVVPEDSYIYLQLTANAAQAQVLRGALGPAEAMIRDTLAAQGHSGAELMTDARPLQPGVFSLRILLVALLGKRGQEAEAEAEARSVLADAERAWGVDEPYLSTAADALADTLLLARRPGEALPVAERAYSLARGRGELGHPKLRYKSAFTLARALAAAGAQPTRADELARTAKSLAAANGDHRTVAAVDTWLADHRAG